MKFNALIEKTEDGWFVGQVEEVPAAISQGRTIEELMDNLLDAVKLLYETNRESLKKDYVGRKVTRQTLEID
jgi:predicted RNase H-like HicB family nuclease